MEPPGATASPTGAASASLHQLLGIAVVLGAAGAVAALAFVAVVSAGQDVLWPDSIDPSAFSGSIRIPIIMTIGGLLVGIIHATLSSAAEENVFVALATGEINAKAIPGGVAIAVVSLIAGFSLGPEVPTGMAAAGIAAWASSRWLFLRRNAQFAMGVTISGAWGGLFTSPFTGLLLNVELTFERRVLRWATIAADATAAIVGFAIFFAVNAGWSDLLRLLELPPYALGLPELAIATGLGVFGAVLGTLFKLSTVATRRLAAPLADRPIVRCTLAGLVLGLIAMALPLTLFLGTEGLADVATEPAALGAGLIVASVIAKIVATTGALSFGFVGGPIFPLLFVGGGMGAVVHLAIDDIPLALAVTAMMAAVPSSVIPVPLSVATLTILIAGVAPSEATAVFTAALVGLITGRLIEAALPKPKAVSTA
jgi:H+/Cl- antiporter ClcA